MDKLRDYQVKTIDHHKAHKVTYDSSNAGLGKTRSVIESCALDEKVLYICPAYLIPNVDKEIKKWRPKQHTNFKLCSYTFLSRAKKELKLPYFDTVVLDEATHIKNPDAKCTMVLLYKILPMAKRVVFISASPIQKSAMDIYAPMRMMYPEDYADPTEFGHTYCNIEYDVYSGATKFIGVKLEAVEELREKFGRYTIKFLKEEVAKELPPIIEDIIYLDPAEDPTYSIDDLDIDHLTEEMKSEYQKLGMEKIPYILDTLESTPHEPTLIFCHHRAVNAKLVSVLQTMGLRVGQILGGIKAQDRQSVVDAFQEQQLDYLVISIDSGGTGLNLPRASRVMFAELPMTYVGFYQAINRAHRMTTTHTVYVQTFVLKGTLDEAILRIIESKKDTSDQIVGRIDNVIKKGKTNGKAKKISSDTRITTNVCSDTTSSASAHTRDLSNEGGKRSAATDVVKRSPRKSTRSNTDQGGHAETRGSGDNSNRSGYVNTTSDSRERLSFWHDDLGLSVIGEDDLGLSIEGSTVRFSLTGSEGSTGKESTREVIQEPTNGSSSSSSASSNSRANGSTRSAIQSTDSTGPTRCVDVFPKTIFEPNVSWFTSTFE